MPPCPITRSMVQFPSVVPMSSLVFRFLLFHLSKVSFLTPRLPRHFKFAVLVGAGVVLGGVGTLASPCMPELTSLANETPPTRATQASPPILPTAPAPTRANTLTFYTPF